VPQYLQSGLHHSLLDTGLMLLPWTGVSMFVTPVAGVLADGSATAADDLWATATGHRLCLDRQHRARGA
jgi:hypothetical protein